MDKKFKEKSRDKPKKKAQKRTYEVAEKEDREILTPAEHREPIGPSGYRPDENELVVDIEDYNKKREEGEFEEIQVEFDVRVIEEVDYKSISRFLESYCHKQAFNNAELTDLLLTQSEIGSVIRELDDIESYGFISMVNVNQHKGKECIKQIKRFVLANCPDSKKGKWKDILESPKLGLLLNERLINIPNQIAPGLHETTFAEVDALKAAGKPFAFDTYLYLTTYSHADTGEDEREEGQEPKPKKQRLDLKKEFFKAEDEIYIKHATETFEFSKSHSETRVAILFAASKVPKILENIKTHVEENFNW